MNYEYTDGYVGCFGRTWKPAGENLDSLVAKAAAYNSITKADVIEQLKTRAVVYSKSTNHHYDHSLAEIRAKASPTATPTSTSKCCECGTPTSETCLMDGMCPDCWHDETDN